MSADDAGFEQVDVFVKGEGGVCEYRIPALAAANKGSLVAVCDARINRPGDAPNKINLAMKRSFDRGRTWTPTQYIAQFGQEEAAADPCILVDRGTGRIWVAYDYATPAEGLPRERDLMFHLIHSDDDGKTWSAPTDLTPLLKSPDWHALQAAPGAGIRTRGGTLVFPVYHLGKDLRRQCRLLCSDDHGQTWTLSAGVDAHGGEPQVVELVDGSVMINMRQSKDKGCRSVAVTQDLGETWSEPYDDKTLVDPGCQACVRRWTDPRDGDDRSRILFSNAAHPTTRRNMTLRLSYDEGSTWPVAKLLHTERSMYSCLALLPDKTIGLLYEKDLNIAFARFTLEWMTDGSDRLA